MDDIVELVELAGINGLGRKTIIHSDNGYIGVGRNPSGKFGDIGLVAADVTAAMNPK